MNKLEESIRNDEFAGPRLADALKDSAAFGYAFNAIKIIGEQLGEQFASMDLGSISAIAGMCIDLIALSCEIDKTTKEHAKCILRRRLWKDPAFRQ